MAGKRQHFIPRLLLRHFSDDQHRIRLIRKTGASLVTSIENVALENQFFGKPGSGTPDESITEEEKRIGSLLNDALALPDGAIGSSSAATLISHFTTRSRAMRTFMKQVGAVAIDRIEHRFSNASTLQSAMLEHLRTNPEELMEMFLSTLSEQYGQSAVDQLKELPNYSQIVNAVHAQAASFLHSIEKTTLVNNFGELIASARNVLDESVTNAHHRVALTNPTPQERAESMMDLDFAVQSSASDLVLSDAVAFGWRESIGATPLFSIESDLQFLVMPLSKRRLIVGWRGERPQQLENELLQAALHVSDEFVLAHPDTIGWESFSQEFGKARSAALEDGISTLKHWPREDPSPS